MNADVHDDHASRGLLTRASRFLTGLVTFPAFRDTLGQAPLQYLTDWRMTLARDHLRTGDLSLARIAGAVGYGSPYAFAAAFRRHHGIPPGAWRQQQPTAPLTWGGVDNSTPRA